jgi:hypothetical protein
MHQESYTVQDEAPQGSLLVYVAASLLAVISPYGTN